MKRRDFIQLPAVSGIPAMPGAVETPSTPQGKSAARERPNLLVLMSDQHNPHVYGAYGDRTVKTPNLDSLAQNGVTFEHTYCQAPLCVPSRMTFLTGQQASEIKVWTNSDYLPSDIPTFAHSLGAEGYEATLIGRMHFNGVDQWHGFEKRLVGSLAPVYPHTPIPLPPRLLIGAQGSSHAAVALAGPGRMSYQVYDEQVAKATVDFLRQKAKEKGRPFCAVSGFVLPHPPFICLKEDWDYYFERVGMPQMPPDYFEKLHPAIKIWRQRRGLAKVTAEEVRRARVAYYGLVTHFDRQVGLILRSLRETGLDKNTVVVYTSDHGEMAGELGMWWKSSFYEGSVSVPLVFACPGRLPAGKRVREVASLVDVGPTLLDLAGGEKMPAATGRSLAKLLTGQDADWPNEAFSEYPSSLGVPASRMIRRGKWKLIHYEGDRPQLFDLESDPHEYRDLGESPEHAPIREKLHARVRAGWSAEEMEKELSRRASRHRVIRKWSEQVKPQSDQQWTAPEGSNVFP